MLSAQHLITLSPKSFLTAGGFGPMGFSLPSAIGAHHANPNTTIIAIDGDGSLLMNLGELFTIGKYQLPIKVLMLNNHGDGMVRNIQQFLYDSNFVGTKKVTDVAFANVAGEMSFGFHKTVRERGKLKSAVKELLAASGPAFLEVICDVNEVLYPRIPAGQGYDGMILGPYMESQEKK
jgi:acetolactate synthase-1/2/3 large subunit